MNSRKFLLILCILALIISGCRFFSSVAISPTQAPTSIPLSSVTIVPSIVATEIATQTPLAVSPQSCASAIGQLPLIATPETSTITGVDISGHVKSSLGGGLIQSEAFSIELYLHCDEHFGPGSLEPFWQSDINGLAVFINWRYSGKVEDAPTFVFYGLEPDLVGHTITNQEQGLFGGFGISEGIKFPSTPLPDFSTKVPVRFVYIVLYPSGNYTGAALSFDLQQAADGIHPVNVIATPLSYTDISRLPQNQPTPVQTAVVNTAGTQPQQANCPASWFFTFDNTHLPLAAFCPEPVLTLDAVGQDFEGGRAYRYAPDPGYSVDQRGTVFVIYNDGEWVTFPDNWDITQASSDPNLVVPAGRYQPVDSIGKVWRENVLNVRDRLGWAYEPQARFTGRIQRYFVQQGLPSGDTHFFFVDHGKWGTVLLLNSVDMGPNTWEVAGTY